MIATDENLHKNVIMNFNFAIFSQIFIKFSPKCKTYRNIYHFGKILLNFNYHITSHILSHNYDGIVNLNAVGFNVH